MNIDGKTWKFGDNINTDEIIPACYLNSSNPEELKMHCMAGIDEGFVGRAEVGDILLAGQNFGCGSSREHAPISIKALGISCVVACSFARIFYRNSINIGLPILELGDDALKISEGDSLNIDLSKGIVINTTSGETYKSEPFPPFMQELIAAGGLIPYVSKHYVDKAS